MATPVCPSGEQNTRKCAWRTLLIGLIVVGAGSAWGVYEWERRRAAPPPSKIGPVLLNTRSGVKYVGSARCGECHEKEASTYRQHPMGRSVSSAGQRLPFQNEADPAFEASGLHFAVERKADAILHREFVRGSGGQVPLEQVAEVAFAVGSGRQGQSFLVNRNGRLFQSPVSWYSHKQAWDLSPGFQGKNEHFTRPIPEGCLFCHVNEARIEPGTVNQYRPAPLRLEPIGCERCHGPGELHVADRAKEEAPTEAGLTIVNPRRLEPPLRDAVCEQCHLQGEARIERRGRSVYDYRPGLPLHEFVAVYVRPPEQVDPRKAVSHVEQMHLSRCFRESSGKLGCISCHDPHVLPSAAERVAWYRGRCLSCHEDTSCTLTPAERRRQNPADSCIDCHMPRDDSSNVAHAAITDHRIVRRPLRPGPGGADGNPPGYSLVSFHSDGGGPRDLGLALLEMMDRPFLEPRRREIARKVCGLLRPALSSAADDLPALEGLAAALWRDERSREALDTLENVLSREPRRELALEKAGRVALDLKDDKRSVRYWRRLLAVNPDSWKGHAFEAQALALGGQWAAATDECRSALTLNPFEVPARMLLIDCLVHKGDRKQAQAEFDTLLALSPSNADPLRRWFDDLLRSDGRP
jgi:hypothetical protein